MLAKQVDDIPSTGHRVDIKFDVTTYILFRHSTYPALQTLSLRHKTGLFSMKLEDYVLCYINNYGITFSS